MKGTKGLDERIGSWIQPIQPQPIAVGVYWLPWTFGKKWDATFAAAQLEMKFSSFHSALIPATSCARWSPRDTPLISRDKSTEELRRYGCAAESLASDLGRCFKNLKDLKSETMSMKKSSDDITAVGVPLQERKNQSLYNCSRQAQRDLTIAIKEIHRTRNHILGSMNDL